MRICEAALRLSAAVDHTRPDEAAGVGAQTCGPVELKPEQKKISGYFNVDNGSGKIRGVYLQGNAAIAPIFAAVDCAA